MIQWVVIVDSEYAVLIEALHEKEAFLKVFEKLDWRTRYHSLQIFQMIPLDRIDKVI